MSTIVLLNSGGLDSLAVAMLLKEQKHIVHSLYIDLGQRSKAKGIVACRRIADAYCDSHEVIVMFPDDRYLIEMKNGPNLPFMGAALFILGSVYARSKGIDFIASGLKGDSNKDDFNTRFLHLLKASKMTKPVIPLRPVSGMKDFKEVFEVIKDSPIMRHTYSCNVIPKCGGCVKCKLRKKYSID